jgi:hypothetical protein
MAEISVTPEQVRAITAMLPADNKGGVRVLCPPEGELFDSTYVEVRLTDPEGKEVEREIFTYAGVRPRTEAIPPEWDASDG